MPLCFFKEVVGYPTLEPNISGIISFFQVRELKERTRYDDKDI